MLIYFISQPNVSYFYNNTFMRTFMNTHSQKQHNKKQKIPTRRKEMCSFVYE